MKTHDPLQVAASLLSSDVLASDRCCGEAGTLAVSRPDIADQLRSRKREELQHGIEELTGGRVVENKPVKLLTSCPACQQGLSRYQQDTGLETEYIVVALVRQLIGENWSEQFIENMQNGGIERVLL